MIEKNRHFLVTFSVRQVLPILLGLIFLLALYFFLRGHNEPGGGFIAGVVLSIGITLTYICRGENYLGLTKIEPITLSVFGMIIAICSAVAPLFLGDPFLTQYMTYANIPILGNVHVGTPLIFDLGILFCVTGVISQMVISFTKSVIEQKDS